MKADESFTSIAPYYDRLMSDVNYGAWIKYIEELFSYAGSRPHKILDLACGTGTPTLLLADRGYEVVGVDRSEEMLEVARSKLKKGDRVRLLKQDIRKLELDEKFDAALCLFDSLNNLLKEEDLFKAFERTRIHLEDGAPFIFDLNTPYCLRYYWGDNVRVKEDDDLISIWRTSYNRKKGTSRLHITLLVPLGNGLFNRIDEEHLEKGYEREDVERLLREAGFERVYAFEHLSFRPPSPTTLRITFLAK